MKSINLMAVYLAAILIASGMLLSLPGASASEGDLHIFPPTNVPTEIEMDSSVVYKWGVFNNGTHPHTVLVDVYGDEHLWEATVENAYFLIEPGEFQTVDIIVTAPNTRDYPEYTLVVNATVRDLVTEEMWFKDMGVLEVTVSGGAYVPPTKVLGWFDNPLAGVHPFLDSEWGVFITTVLVWLVVGAFIYFILDPVVKHFTKSTETEIDDKVLAIVKGPVFGLIIAYGVVSSLQVLNLSWAIIHGLDTLFKLLLIVLVAWMAFKVFRDVLLIWGKKYAEKTETNLDDVMLPLFEKVGLIVIVSFAIISILNLFGVDVTMLVAGMGIMGLVIAFAAQDTLGNFISGMFLLTDRPFKVGDLVLMENGDYCRVEKIGMRSTKLYNTFDHDVIVVPNSKIANEKVINLTEPDNKMKINLMIGVDYATDLEKAKEIMLNVALNHKDVMKEEGHAPFVRTVEFADSSINLKLYGWVYHLDDQWRVASELREEIFRKFKEAGIEIPFPQRVVHMERE